MNHGSGSHVDPKLDLVLERIIEVPKERIWMAWTNPEHLKKWFTPAPWTTAECDIDLRPGGVFRTLMQSPEGQQFDNSGCYLEVVENEKLVWTSALLPNYRPADLSSEDLPFTAIIKLESHEQGTKYTAIVMHRNEADCARHAEMGFYEGWGRALDQLVQLTGEL